MKLSVVYCLVLAAFIVRAFRIKDSDFSEDTDGLGDVEGLDSSLDIPSKDGETVVLNGNPEDKVDMDLDIQKKGEDIGERLWWHRHHHHYHRHNHTRTYRAHQFYNMLKKPSSSRCIRKSIIMLMLDQPKKVTQTYCLTAIKLSQTVYHVGLVQDENLIFDNKVLMMEPFKEVCVSFLSAPDRNACMNFRLEGSSFCASVAADFWADWTMNVDFGCMDMVQTKVQ